MAETSCTYVGGCLKMESERPNFETQPTNCFFFGLRDLRQFVRSLYKAQAPTIAIVIQRLGMMRDSIHHLLVVLILYRK